MKKKNQKLRFVGAEILKKKSNANLNNIIVLI